MCPRRHSHCLVRRLDLLQHLVMQKARLRGRVGGRRHLEHARQELNQQRLDSPLHRLHLLPVELVHRVIPIRWRALPLSALRRHPSCPRRLLARRSHRPHIRSWQYLRLFEHVVRICVQRLEAVPLPHQVRRRGPHVEAALPCDPEVLRSHGERHRSHCPLTMEALQESDVRAPPRRAALLFRLVTPFSRARLACIPNFCPTSARRSLRMPRSSLLRRCRRLGRSCRPLYWLSPSHHTRRRRCRCRRRRDRYVALVTAVDSRSTHAPLLHDLPRWLPRHEHGHRATWPRTPLRRRAFVRRLARWCRRKSRSSSGPLPFLLLAPCCLFAHRTCSLHITGRSVNTDAPHLR